MRLFRLPEMQATTELVIGCILIMIVVLGFVLHGLWEKHRKRSTGAAGDAKSALLPYKTRPLLTDEEQRFYALLRPEAERAGLDLLAKVRIADFISVAPGLEQDQWKRYYAKIQSKHVDFLLTDRQTLAPRLLIELQTSDACRMPSVLEQEMFIDCMCRSAGLPILHIRGTEDWDQQIAQAIETARQEDAPSMYRSDAAHNQ